MFAWPISSWMIALTTHAGLPADDTSLVPLGEHLKDGPVLAAVMKELGKRPKLEATALLLAKLDSSSDEVRAEAIRSLGLRESQPAREQLPLPRQGTTAPPNPPGLSHRRQGRRMVRRSRRRPSR